MKTIMIDGYNLIHSHPRLSGLYAKEQDSARLMLVRELSPLACPDHYDLVMVVFDAAGSKQPDPVIEEHDGVTVVFTRRNQSADSFIEAAVRHLVAEGEVEVVTSDRDLRAVITGFGARILGPASLFEMAGEALAGTRREMLRMERDSRSPLEDRVSEEVRHILDEMRYR